MGNYIGNWFQSLFKNKEGRVIMVGLDNAGKTTILYKLRLNENIVTIPTIGFNVEMVTYNKVNFTVWDLGGQERIRRLWKNYLNDNDALIFVVDSTDKDRMEDASEELHRLLESSFLRDVAVLVLANKQDMSGTLSANEVADRLQMKKAKQQKWYVQPCSAISGEGLYEGLDWLSNQL